MGESQSQYAYMLCDDGIFRVNIPDLNQEHQHKFKLEYVLDGTSCNISVRSMGAFSQGDDVYLVGGTDNDIDNRSMFIFNPSDIEEYPITNTHSLRKSTELSKPMLYPLVLRAKNKNQIYFFSIVRPYQEAYMESQHFCFQSFDTTENRFLTLPLPTPTDSAMSYCDLSSAGHFVVYNYIYLFIRRSKGAYDIDKLYAFSFNTVSSTWKEINSLLREFERQNIPIPRNHNGDIGLSDVFSDNTQILVALDIGTPTAYRVSVGDDGGSLHPKSYRRLIQLKHRGGHENMSHLLDIGGQRFCVIYCNEDTPLLVYVFKMKFEVEYENQRNSTAVPMTSIKILCSKKFKHPIPLYCASMAHNVCLASAPPSPTCFPCDQVVKHSSKSKDSVQRMPGVPILEF